MNKAVAAMIAATMGLAGPLAAQSAEIDINGDGSYSYPEIQAVLPQVSEDDFDAMDTSGDGLLDAEEIAAGIAAGLLPM